MVPTRTHVRGDPFKKLQKILGSVEGFLRSQQKVRREVSRVTMDFAKALRTARAARGLSQKQLAALAELDSSFISLLESGQRTPSTATLEAISKALEVPIYLIMLLASEPEDLRGLPQKEARVLGHQILTMLTQEPAETD
jgi:transcriptional regulator with XRE-family HTH domain